MSTKALEAEIDSRKYTPAHVSTKALEAEIDSRKYTPAHISTKALEAEIDSRKYTPAHVSTKALEAEIDSRKNTLAHVSTKALEAEIDSRKNTLAHVSTKALEAEIDSRKYTPAHVSTKALEAEIDSRKYTPAHVSTKALEAEIDSRKYTPAHVSTKALEAEIDSRKNTLAHVSTKALEAEIHSRKNTLAHVSTKALEAEIDSRKYTPAHVSTKALEAEIDSRKYTPAHVSTKALEAEIDSRKYTPAHLSTKALEAPGLQCKRRQPIPTQRLDTILDTPLGLRKQKVASNMPAHLPISQQNLEVLSKKQGIGPRVYNYAKRLVVELADGDVAQIHDGIMMVATARVQKECDPRFEILPADQAIKLPLYAVPLSQVVSLRPHTKESFADAVLLILPVCLGARQVWRWHSGHWEILETVAFVRGFAVLRLEHFCKIAPEYSYTDRASLVQYIQDSDIKLVKGSYFLDLQRAGRSLPRRQDAPADAFVANPADCDVIYAVSHAWEAKEHADPFGQQLQLLADFVQENGTRNSGFFFDQTSIYQFRRSPEQNEVFSRCMRNMQLLYAHQSTIVLRITELADEAVQQTRRYREVPVYDQNLFLPQNKSAHKLEQNRVPYHQRGWCSAETQWAACANSITLSLPVRLDDQGRPRERTGVAPMRPRDFEALAAGLRFTHRDADMSPVVTLQKEVYQRLASSCEELTLAHMPAAQMLILADSLGDMMHLRRLSLKNCELTVDGMERLARSLGGLTALSIEHSCCSDGVLRALMEDMQQGALLEELDLRMNEVGQSMAEILAQVQMPEHLTTIKLDHERIARIYDDLQEVGAPKQGRDADHDIVNFTMSFQNVQGVQRELFKASALHTTGKVSEDNVTLSVINILVFLAFVLEETLMCWVVHDYLFSLRFFMDSCATLSILGDTAIVAEIINTDAAVAMRSSGVSRAMRGAGRSTRFISILRGLRVWQILKLLPRLQRLTASSTRKLAMLMWQKRMQHVMGYIDKEGAGDLSEEDFDFFTAALKLEFPPPREEAGFLSSLVDGLAESGYANLAFPGRNKVSPFSRSSSRRVSDLDLGRYVIQIRAIWETDNGKRAFKRCLDDVTTMKESCTVLYQSLLRLILKICILVLALLLMLQLLNGSIPEQARRQGLQQLQAVALEAPNSSATADLLCQMVETSYAYSFERHSLLLLVIDQRVVWDTTATNPCSNSSGGFNFRKLGSVEEAAVLFEDVIDGTGKERHEMLVDQAEDLSWETSAIFDQHQQVRWEAGESLKYSLSVVAMLALLMLYFSADIMHMSSQNCLHPLWDLMDDMNAMKLIELITATNIKKIDQDIGVTQLTRSRCKCKPFAPVPVAQELLGLRKSMSLLESAMIAWSKYVPVILLKQVMNAGVEANIGCIPTQVSIFFCDIKGFKEICTGKTPKEVLSLLDVVLEGVNQALEQNGGTLLEFIGDEVVCDARGSADKLADCMFVAACLLVLSASDVVCKLKRCLVDETDLQGSAV
ncbi:unnamed protein product [Symbiodinium sp. CCMP2592]|nr:unnamed protein product [Symbiodinium sp. CCMP2592]